MRAWCKYDAERIYFVRTVQECDNVLFAYDRIQWGGGFANQQRRTAKFDEGEESFQGVGCRDKRALKGIFPVDQ